MALAAVLIEEEARRISMMLEHLVDVPYPLVVFTVMVAFLAAVNQWLVREDRWRIRTALVWIAGISMVGLLVWVLILRPSDFATLPDASIDKHDLATLTLLAAGLWSIDLILNYRRVMRNPDRTTRSSSLLVWVGTAVLGTIAAAIVVRYPSLLVEDELSRLGWAEPRVEVMFRVSSVVLIWLGLSRIISRTVRLAGALELHGYLPALAPGKPGSWRRQLSGLSLITILLVPAAIFVSSTHLLEFSALAYLWATILTFLPHVRRPARELNPDRANRLPLHPLFPLLGLAASLFFSLILPDLMVLIGVGWLLFGAAIFISYGHRAKSQASVKDDSNEDLADDSGDPEFQVLVGLDGNQGVEALITTGAALAQAHSGGLVFLKVVPQSGELSIEASKQAAVRARQDLEELSGKFSNLQVPVRSLVRIAPSISSGMSAAARELNCGFMLLGNRGSGESPGREAREALEEVFRSTSKPLAVVIGRLPDKLERIVVATGGGPHAAQALRLGRDLGLAAECPVELVCVSSRAREEADPVEILRQTREKAEVLTGIESRVIDADAVGEGLRGAVDENAILIMGASVDRLLKQTIFEGLSEEIARSRQAASIVVKRAEKVTRFWRRRLWELLSGPMPQLSVSERSEVYSLMRHSARATVDFYMLTSLASAIALLGLLLNSSAVIIGAMLVAPLMSPILATAQGIVQGNLYLIRRALASTIKGSAAAVGVATGLTLLLPATAPTSEILARVEPNLLDLLVAMAAGGAAAYAMSRKSVAAALPGVAISVALVPPLCVVGYGLGSSQLAIGWGALVLFLTNLVGIVLVGAIIFLLLGFRPTQVERGAQARRAAVIAFAGLALLIIPLGLATLSEVREQRIRAQLEQMLDKVGGERVESRSYSIREEKGVFVIHGRIWVFDEISDSEFEQFRLRLEEATGVPIRLRVTVVRARLAEVGPTAKSTAKPTAKSKSKDNDH